MLPLHELADEGGRWQQSLIESLLDKMCVLSPR
ncbi:MAG: hypothetical protein QOE70_2962 [Chthoniobacter sp.]|nr:hypothetical protein [Chthoniobacter sp.]